MHVHHLKKAGKRYLYMQKQLIEGRKRRRDGKTRAFEKAHESATMLSNYLGRDFSGKPAESIKPEDLNMGIRNWHVMAGYGWEVRDNKYRDSSEDEIEDAIRQGKEERSPRVWGGHILRVSRALTHIRNRYEDEMHKTEETLEKLENARLQLQGGEVSARDIKRIMADLIGLKQDLSKKYVALKVRLGNSRVNAAIRTLNEVKLARGSNREQLCRQSARQIGNIQTRLGEFRTEQIARIYEYTNRRADTLRMERDLWLERQLTDYSQNTDRYMRFQLIDRFKVATLAEIGTLVGIKCSYAYMKKFLDEYASLFRVPSRKAEGAADHIENYETGTATSLDEKFDILFGHYELLGRYINARRYEDAMKKVQELKVFVMANKPRFVFEELKKGAEPYLADVLDHMEKGVSFFDVNQQELASREFRQAAQILGGMR